MKYFLILFILLGVTPLGMAQTTTAGSSSSKLPPLKIQAKVGTKRDQQSNSFYMQTMTISPQVVIEGASTQPLPALEATMLIVTMDTEAKFRHRQDKFDVHARETISIPAVDRGARRSFDFKPSRTSFDSWRDKSNVGGAVYKYFVFGLRDPATQTLVYFETNHPKLDKMVKTNPAKRDEVLKLAPGTEFPKEFN